MRTIIVDDDPMSLKMIQQFAEQTDYIDLVGTFSNAESAAQVLEEEDTDLALLDVEMPGMTGLELIKKLERKPQIILITSKQEYAIEAFEQQVTDYLLKPVEYKRFLRAVEKAKDVHDSTLRGSKIKTSLFVKEESVWINIPFKSILWVEALGDYVTLHTTGKKYTILSTMKEIDKKLPQDRFMRIHRSFIINLEAINNLDGNMVVVDQKLVPIGKSYKKSLLNRLNIL